MYALVLASLKQNKRTGLRYGFVKNHYFLQLPLEQKWIQKFLTETLRPYCLISFQKMFVRVRFCLNQKEMCNNLGWIYLEVYFLVLPLLEPELKTELRRLIYLISYQIFFVRHCLQQKKVTIIFAEFIEKLNFKSKTYAVLSYCLGIL